jgi:ferric-dicitrate binding protein FerR (iron transport regulator)
MHHNDRINYLLQRYRAGTISSEEHDELFEHLSSPDHDRLLAQSIQEDLKEGFDGNLADLPPHVAQEIVRNIFNAEKDAARILPLRKKATPMLRWIAAASIILLTGLSVFFLVANKQGQQDQFASLIPGSMLSEKNNGSDPQRVVLSDGTEVTLQPRSVLHFPKNFTGDSREVYLEGEAFFNVERNPQKAFLVYYNDIVTKVLGTSFRVNTNAITGNIEVAVTTGKVQVYENAKLLQPDQNVKAVIVTPNQKAIYQAEKRLFETALVESPQPIPPKGENHPISPSENSVRLSYDQTKLAKVLGDLETEFGIEIEVENTNLDHCVFTGELKGYDLFTSMKMICLATGSAYEVNGTRVLVKGKGCK